MEAWHLLYILLPLAAFLYASVGHGGASSYLMLLALFDFAPENIRPAALLMNMVVSLLAFIYFRSTAYFPKKMFFILIAFSMPAAYWGGTIWVDTLIYKKIVGVLLLFPIMRFLKAFPKADTPLVEEKFWMVGLIGLSVGFFSGLIGIGGGIILSPILLMLGWTNFRETAAISALFIFLNSLSGFIGSATSMVPMDKNLLTMMPATILAGAGGAYLGAKRFNLQVVRYLLTAVLAFASIKFILL